MVLQIPEQEIMYIIRGNNLNNDLNLNSMNNKIRASIEEKNKYSK